MRPGYVQFHGPQIFTDSLIVKRSGLARVTSVARSNYDLVNSACFFLKSCGLIIFTPFSLI